MLPMLKECSTSSGDGNYGASYRLMEKEEGEEWEVVEYYVDDDECEEKQKWSSRMMDAGKKLIMTGVLIASVPVLLPPLLAVSALGFAMSVPFGVVFASYTASHKLMAKLLPLPIPCNYQEEYSSNEEEEEEMKMQSSDDAENEIEMRIELVDDEDPLVADVDDDVQLIIGVERKLEDEEEGESMKQLVEESADDGESSSSSSEYKNIIHADDDQELDETQNKMSVETKQGPVLMDDDDVKQGNHDTPADEDQVKMAADDDSLESKEEKQRSGLNGGLHEMQMQGGGGGGDEEKRIWKKINAIRVIVGFKAPRRSSYLEEVKALYLFTGIEPPPTSAAAAAAATSSELDAKLSFLMSVIGLK